MTTITLTKAQADEFDNDFWHIEVTYTDSDGVEQTFHTDDDDFREIPERVLIGDLGWNEDETEAYISHPLLTWQEEIILKAELDEREKFTVELGKLATPELRAAARVAKRTELRREARQDARRIERAKLRRENRQAARDAMRADLEAKHADALASEPAP